MIKTTFQALFFIFIMAFSHTNADDAPDCFKDVETTFFNNYLVTQALGMHSYTINQGQWDPILTDLRTKARSVPDRVRAAANKLSPNPLDYPYNNKDAAQVLFVVLYGVFKEVMYENYITDDSSIQDMFHYIRNKQITKLQNCFGEESSA